MSDSMPFIEASGSNYEIGCQLGEFSREALPAFLEHEKVRQDREAILADTRVLSRSLKAAADRYPKLMDELRGIADGAGLAFEDVFIFNWRPRPRHVGVAEGCTTVIVPKADRVLIGHNEDWFAGTNGVFLARLKTDDGALDCLAVCYHGFLAGLSGSINHAGLAQSLNTMIASDCGAGVPLTLIDRAALEATSIDDAVTLVSQPGRSDSENFNFAQRTEAVYVETSGQEAEVVRVTSPTAHTNHILSDRLRPLEASPRTESSRARHARATRLLADLDDPGPDDIRAILSDHDGDPLAICRHGREDACDDYCDTLATVIIDTADFALDVCFGPPCRSEFRRFML